MASGDEGLIQLLMAAVLVAAVAFDLKERRIPNWITLPGILVGLALQAVRGGADGLVIGLVGAAAGAALLAIPFALGWTGGGDLKLLAAVGAFMGAPFAIWALLFACAVGGLMAVVRLVMAGSLAVSARYMFLAWLPRPVARPLALATFIPFGPAIALGAFATAIFRG